MRVALAALAIVATGVPAAAGTHAAPGHAQAAAADTSPAEARAIHAIGASELPSEMLVGFAMSYLKDLLGPMLTLEDGAGSWPDERVRALLSERFAPYAERVDAAIFESVGRRLASGQAALLVAAAEQPAKAAALRCAITSTPGPGGPLWDSCGAGSGVVLEAAFRAAGQAYIDALNAAITERPTNAGLGTAVCATAQEIARSMSTDGFSLNFTRLTFGLGPGSERPCAELPAEAARLWPEAAAGAPGGEPATRRQAP